MKATNLSLTVEPMVASTIDDVAQDLCELADRLELMVEANFNGVMLRTFPGGNAQKLAAEYRDAIKRRPPSRQEAWGN